MNYQGYLQSDDWDCKKEKAYKLHGNKCQKCRSETNLQIHHATYENIYDEKLSDLVILCETCHELFHKQYGTDNLKDNTFIFLNGQEMFDKRQAMIKELEQREARLRQIQETKERIFNK